MRATPNRSGEMEVFVRVVELDGFSAAARALRMTPSTVSKLVARLEARLGARLLNRSTRTLRLTPEGCAFYERSLAILADVDAAEREAGAGAEPRGRIKVSANVPFGLHRLLPLIPDFLAAHPHVALDIELTDRVIDLLEERADVAIRTGPLRDSELVARKLGWSRMAVVAAPSYLARCGEPQSLDDLARLSRIGFNFPRSFEGWPFLQEGRPVTLPVAASVLVGDGEAVRSLALAGAGLARLALFHVGPDIAAGRLQPVLEELNPGDVQDIHAVFLDPESRQPARTRAFIDFLTNRLHLS